MKLDDFSTGCVAIVLFNHGLRFEFELANKNTQLRKSTITGRDVITA